MSRRPTTSSSFDPTSRIWGQNPQANAAQPANDNLPAETPEGYQVPRGAACILGGVKEQAMPGCRLEGGG